MKKALKIFGILLLVVAAYYSYLHFGYRFEEVSAEKVYKSGLIDPEKIEKYLLKYNIKTVVDLLHPGVQDSLNPATQKEIQDEDRAIAAVNEKYDLEIRHVNIPSHQVPTKETLTKFFEVMDEEANYPVLIHCYHGVGRAQIYSALYRIEYENWSNADARAKTRLVVEGLGYHSSFADGKPKGEFLMHYKPRSAGADSTIENLSE